MKKLFLMVCGLLLLFTTRAQALTVTTSGLYLNEIVNGVSHLSDLTGALFDGTGLLSRTYTSPGTYSILALIDSDLDLELTGWDPEFGMVAGDPLFDYQIGDPYGDLGPNFLSGALDGKVSTDPGDVAVAMAWNFTLLTGQMAQVSFSVGTDAPPGPNYLAQYDAVYLEPYYELFSLPDSIVYYTAALDIEDTGSNPIPEPSTFVLFGSALAACGLYARRRRNG